MTGSSRSWREPCHILEPKPAAVTPPRLRRSTGSFFDTGILLANPNLVEAPVSITYLRGDGTTVPQTLTVAPTSRTTIRVDQIPGLENAEVSATVTSTAAVPIVVEGTMRWDSTGYGAHTDKATEGPSTTWFFAEWSQGFFDTYVLLANGDERPAVRIRSAAHPCGSMQEDAVGTM